MKQISFLFATLAFLFSSLLSAVTDYEILDIGTLQTQSSAPISINNRGQILGWYNTDGGKDSLHYFIRNVDGVFYELPKKESGIDINWSFLTDSGKAYGTFAVNQATNALCTWDEKIGLTKLGNMPGKDVVAVNNAGQVLIKSVARISADGTRSMKGPGSLGK